MQVNIKNLVSMLEANQNFSKVTKKKFSKHACHLRSLLNDNTK